MKITYLREFWFGDRVYNDTANHPHYHTVRFADRPNIDAQIWLTIVSPGATFSGIVNGLCRCDTSPFARAG
jgi:hypothetical protein